MFSMHFWDATSATSSLSYHKLENDQLAFVHLEPDDERRDGVDQKPETEDEGGVLPEVGHGVHPHLVEDFPRDSVMAVHHVVGTRQRGPSIPVHRKYAGLEGRAEETDVVHPLEHVRNLVIVDAEPEDGQKHQQNGPEEHRYLKSKYTVLRNMHGELLWRFFFYPSTSSNILISQSIACCNFS